MEELVERQTLRVSGRRELERFEIQLGDQHLYLTGCSFRYLFGLIYGRIVNAASGGWVHKRDIDEYGNNHARNIYRLEKEIRDQVGRYPRICANDRCGRYRLEGEYKFEFDWHHLASFPDHRVVDMAQKIREVLEGKSNG